MTTRIARTGSASLAAIAISILAACAPPAGPGPKVTVTVPATPDPTAAVTPTAPAPPATVYTFGDEWLLAPETEAQGSGCAPGAGELPDGVWFGFIDKWSTSEISFDLACWWTGEGAITAAGWGPEDALDFYISNDVTTLRKEPVGPGAVGLKASPEEGVFPLADVIADPGGSLPTQQPYPAWLFINGGVVTGVAVQYLP